MMRRTFPVSILLVCLVSTVTVSVSGVRSPQSHEEYSAAALPIRSLQWDPWVQGLVDQVNTDSLTNYIQRLQDFVTREATTESSYAASQWLLNRFGAMGYAAEFDSFLAYHPHSPGTSGYERNVIATLPGGLSLPTYYIISGHFDAISEIPGYAPGADDNASGTACTLEAARIFSAEALDHTLEFVCWAAEELAHHNGSDHYVGQALAEGWDLGGVVNLDMIGYMNDALPDCQVRTEGTVSYPIGQLFIAAAETYVPSLICVEIEGTGGDSSPFSYYGFRTLLAIENAPGDNPYFHGSQDIIDHLSPELYTAITQTAVATMAVLGISPRLVEDVEPHDIGDGNSLRISWSSSQEDDVIGYSVMWGMTSGQYTDSAFVGGIGSTSHTVAGLVTDSTYYFVVRAVDSGGYPSWVASEVSAAPRVTPLPPWDVIATPIPQGIRVDWWPNQELDLDGYLVYRRINDSASYDTLTAEVISDTTFTDYPLSGENRYFYAIQAVDLTGNASVLSAEAYGRPITLDQGLLVVDETRDDADLPDSLQDEFYAYVLAGTQSTQFAYGAVEERPLLADMGPYSTVVWHADDYQQLLASQAVADLQTYLDAGGNLWFMGWKPTAGIAGAPGYPEDFAAGDFMYDYLKVSHVELSGAGDSFQAAVGLSGYPRVDVDPEKVPWPSWGGAMRYVEALTSVAPGEDIYTIDMQNDGSPFEGLVCGVRYLGEDFKTMFLGSPLYYMDREQARLLAHKVLNDFGEPVGVTDDPGGTLYPLRIVLHQNVPNPFSDQTTISYGIPERGRVTLRIYNLAGHLVSTLVNAQQSGGLFAVIWDGTDQGGTPVGAGTYFYKLQAGAGTATKRLTILR
jgi:hypothetical protein